MNISALRMMMAGMCMDSMTMRMMCRAHKGHSRTAF